jgi:hypothetical protein
VPTPGTTTRKLVRLWLRPTALALALTATAGQLSAVVHMLLVPHAVCPEHGALVHVASDTARARERDSSARSEYRDAGELSESDQHDHCLADAARRAASLVASPLSSKLAVGALAGTPAVCGPESAERSVDLLSLAPKSSPPSARA